MFQDTVLILAAMENLLMINAGAIAMLMLNAESTLKRQDRSVLLMSAAANSASVA